MSLFRPASILLLSLLAFVACSKRAAESVIPAAMKPPAPPPVGKVFAGPWQTESQYIVSSVARDLMNMAVFARQGAKADFSRADISCEEILPAAKQPLRYRLHFQPIPGNGTQSELSVTGAIWDPAAYVETARVLLTGLTAKQTETAPNDNEAEMNLIRVLTSPNAEVIERENQTLSAELTADMLRPELHERAALVLAAFVLREYSGDFRDTKAEMARITAHLAIAQALRQGAKPGVSGAIAHAALVTLYVDQRTALFLIDNLPAGSPWTEAWRRALRLRVTMDYRQSAGVAKATALERREEFLARVVGLGAGQADAMLPEGDSLRRSIDWLRILNANSYSVDLGHVLHELALKSEHAEAMEIAALVGQGEMGKEEYFKFLNSAPEPCVYMAETGPAVRIIGRGHWGSFFQRHLCECLVSDHKFLDQKWGVPQYAADLRKVIDEEFNPLFLHPFVRRYVVQDEPTYEGVQDEAMEMIRREPQRVPVAAWLKIREIPPKYSIHLSSANALADEWFSVNPLPGTAEGVMSRTYFASMNMREDLYPLLDRLHQQAPYDQMVSWVYLYYKTKYTGTAEASGPAMEEAYGPLLDYTSYLADSVATSYKNDPDRMEYWLKRASSLGAAYLYPLAELYVRRGQEAEAVATFEKAYSLNPSAVSKANRCGWLVKYYERHGRQADATRIAQFAAGVYSEAGLEIYGWLQHQRGNFIGEKETYRQIYERYDRPLLLVGLLLHESLSNKRGYDDHPDLRALVEKHVAGGLQKVELAILSGAPHRGAMLSWASDETEKAGLQKTDIIVAARGFRAETGDAFKAICNMEPDTPFSLIVWRQDHYLELKAAPIDNNFHVKLKDYVAK